jgi:hypothetical protein
LHTASQSQWLIERGTLHGITLRYSESVRNGRYATLPTSHQRLNTVSIGYTLLGQARLGAVDWRKPPQNE